MEDSFSKISYVGVDTKQPLLIRLMYVCKLFINESLEKSKESYEIYLKSLTDIIHYLKIESYFWVLIPAQILES
ncbi:MAG: hypothetical protein MHPSP_001037, partial [Paramarteilia canceri]